MIFLIIKVGYFLIIMNSLFNLTQNISQPLFFIILGRLAVYPIVSFGETHSLTNHEGVRLGEQNTTIFSSFLIGKYPKISLT